MQQLILKYHLSTRVSQSDIDEYLLSLQESEGNMFNKMLIREA